VAKAYEAGINFFDTAAIYGRGRSEEFLGRAIKELGLRGHVYIATKIPGEWLRRVDILVAVENQRRRRNRLNANTLASLLAQHPNMRNYEDA